MTPTIAPDGVTRHWPSQVVMDLLDSTDVAALLRPGLAIGPDGPVLEELPTAEVIGDLEGLRAQFLASFSALAIANDAPPVTDVQVGVQVWRKGYDLPVAAYAGDYVGWCVLDATPGRHPESGAIAVSDPRAGSDMTAMPGLPWGRQVMIRAITGGHLAVPGWLTCSVVPVETGQYALVAFASSAG